MSGIDFCISFPVELRPDFGKNSLRYGHILLAEGAKNVSVSENGVNHDSGFLFFR